jgi:hypothetical protein
MKEDRARAALLHSGILWQLALHSPWLQYPPLGLDQHFTRCCAIWTNVVSQWQDSLQWLFVRRGGWFHLRDVLCVHE